jgi:predicted DNA-binding transcriptional regulator YafY
VDYKQLHRLNLLVEQLGHRRRRTFRELHDAYSDRDLKVDERTLRRDLKMLKDRFGFEYEVDTRNKTYFIPQAYEQDARHVAELFGKLDTALLMNSLGVSADEIRTLIAVDQPDWETGLRHVKSVIEAITKRRVLRFMHTDYDTNETNERSIAPCFVKQYGRTWYMYGFKPKDPDEYRIFGLDRVQDLTLSIEPFTPNKTPQQIRQFFEEYIGVVLSQDPIERVVLKAWGRVGQVLVNNPLHPSQRSEQKGDYVLITLQVHPNFGLDQEILKHGEEIHVLEPSSYVENIRNRIQKMSDRYRE